MTNLLKAELNRWFSRRLFWAMLLAAVGVSLLVMLGMSQAYRPQSPAEIAQAERDYADAQQQAEQDRKDCIDSGQSAQDCDTWTPQRSDFVYEPPTYASLVGNGAQTATMIAQLAALVAAASYMGAEFKSGSLATWLTYVPRRTPVFASKAVVAVIGSAVLGAVVHAIMQIGMVAYAWNWLGASGLQGAAGEWGIVGRGLIVTAGAGLLGYCLATLFGSTIAPLGALLGIVVAQWMAGIVTLLVGAMPWLIQLMPDNNLNAFVNGQFETLFVVRGTAGEEVEQVIRIGLGQASLYLGCLLIVVVASALWSFTRCEVR